MKLGSVVGLVLVAGTALAATVWIGRYSPVGSHPGPSALATPAVAEADDDGLPVISPTGPYPKAVADEAEFDFGAMAVGAEMQHTFIIRNEGEASLVLKQGATTCKCTLSEVAKGEIPPGESVEVVLTWEPKGEADNFRQSATIHTNDPEAKELQLVVKGRVEAIVNMSPPDRWNLGDIDDGEVLELEGTVHSGVLDTFEVLGVETSTPLLSAEAVPLEDERLEELKAKSGYAIKAKLEPKMPIGAINEKVTIKTDIPGAESLTLHLSGRRPGPVRIIPTAGVVWHADAMALDLGQFAGADGKKAVLSMFVLGAADEKLEFTEVESDLPEYVKIKLEHDPSFPAKDRKRYTLTFEVVPGTPPMTRLAKESVKIRVKTNHPVASEMKFYVQFVTI